MSDDFYRLLDWIVYTRIVYTKYYNRVLWVERLVYIIGGLLTCSGVMGFLNSAFCPSWFAATVVFFGQAMTICYPHLPFTKRRYAIDYMLDDYREIETQVESAWRSESEDSDKLEQLTQSFRRVDKKYLGSETIRFSESLKNLADVEKRTEMHVRFGVIPSDYYDAETGKPIEQ